MIGLVRRLERLNRNRVRHARNSKSTGIFEGHRVLRDDAVGAQQSVHKIYLAKTIDRLGNDVHDQPFHTEMDGPFESDINFVRARARLMHTSLSPRSARSRADAGVLRVNAASRLTAPVW